MNKLNTVAVFAALGMTAGTLSANSLEEHVTFQMSFEDSMEVDRANGNDKFFQRNHPNVQSSYTYVEGAKGKALYNKGTQGQVRTYEMQENINFEKPGSISVWIKPVEWVKLTENSKKGQNGRYHTITTAIFSTGWNKTGYIVLERATSDLLNRRKKLRMLFPLFAGVRSYYEKEFDWQDNQWYNVVMTWDGSHNFSA